MTFNFKLLPPAGKTDSDWGSMNVVIRGQLMRMEFGSVCGGDTGYFRLKAVVGISL